MLSSFYLNVLKRVKTLGPKNMMDLYQFEKYNSYFDMKNHTKFLNFKIVKSEKYVSMYAHLLVIENLFQYTLIKFAFAS